VRNGKLPKAGGETEELLKELRQIRKLLVSSLIISGVEATTIAKILGYKGVSSISNEIPVGVLKTIIPVVKVHNKDHGRQ
jgi:glutamine amidotransferase PdxT